MEFLDEHEIDLVEISDGSYDIDHDRKLEYITYPGKKRNGYLRGRLEKKGCYLFS